jgi:nicotinamidase/pyrazinamidase
MAIDSRRDALIVVDLQPDFMPGGPLAVAEGDRIAAPIGRLARHFSTVVATQDWHPPAHVSFAERGGPWPPHCLAGSAGAEVHPGLPDELVTSKVRKGTGKDVDSYSGFRDDAGAATGLAGYLRERGVREVWLAGLATDFCVAHSALDAVAQGFAVTLLEDACRAIDLDGSLARMTGSMRDRGVHFALAEELQPA